MTPWPSNLSLIPPFLIEEFLLLVRWEVSRYYLKKKNFNVYLFLKERQSMSGGRAERQGDTESKAGSRL